jgi:Flp pilus assembly protein CpaB
MNPAEMIVLIVLIVVIGVVAINKARTQQGAGADRTDDSTEARQLREEVRALKERIHVLERLATDDTSSVRLDREIEALRDRSSERTRHD